MSKRPSRDEAGVARLSVLYLGVVVLLAVGLALFTTPKRSPQSATKVTGVAAGGSSEAIFLIPANASVYVLTGSGSEFEDIATTIRMDDSKFR